MGNILRGGLCLAFVLPLCTPGAAADAEQRWSEELRVAAMIDAALAKQWEADHINPAPLADDGEFLRRASLDLIGRIPSVMQAREFLGEPSPDKRREYIDRLLEAIRYVTAQLEQKIPTSLLNRTLHDAIERRQPVSNLGHRLKFYYAAQVRQIPPTFLLFVNREDLYSDSYGRYLAGELRKAFGYEGCPLVLVPKPRPKTIEPHRREAARKSRPATKRGRRR